MKIEPILLASLSTWLGTATEGRDSETHKVVLSHPPRHNTTAYLKLYDAPRQAIAELIASQLGRALGLSIPQPFLVVVDRSLLPVSSKFHGAGLTWAFASAQAGETPVSFARLINREAHGALHLLETWPQADSTAAFDEWLANTDRNLGNIMYDGHGRTFWLIDHGRALTGEYWPIWGLDNPALPVRNLFLEALLQVFPHEPRRTALRENANALMLKATLINLDQVDQNNYFARLDPQISKQQIVEFVRSRVHNTVALLCQKIGLPDLISPNQTTH